MHNSSHYPEGNLALVGAVSTAPLPDLQINLLKRIEQNPGIRYRELARLTGLVNGVLSYHLALLQRSNLALRIELLTTLLKWLNNFSSYYLAHCELALVHSPNVLILFYLDLPKFRYANAENISSISCGLFVNRFSIYWRHK